MDCMRGDQRDHSVSTATEPVNPMGHPMSYSTKSGLKLRVDGEDFPPSVCVGKFRSIAEPSCSRVFSEKLSNVIDDASATQPWSGREDGNVAAWVARFIPCSPASWLGDGLVCRFSFGDARGVDHIAT